jgi:formimidoylglutamate deiminase
MRVMQASGFDQDFVPPRYVAMLTHASLRMKTGIMQHHVFERALTPQGWADKVAVRIGDDGLISHVLANAAEPVTLAGLALPGVFNLHSHSFQRGMAGLAERPAGAGAFWSWRGVMYRFASLLSPDDVEAIAAQTFVEMVEAGFTGVAEFHYLHHGFDGQPYADPAELAARIVAAAEDVGLRLTLLPVFYAHAGAGGRAPEPEQQRFIHDLDGFSRLMQRCEALVSGTARHRLGLAPHSLRAATLSQIAALVPMAKGGPIHIHAAEQRREIKEVSAVLGARPIEVLLDHVGIDAQWCVIHATHMTPGEVVRLAGSGAVAGLCPITEANLGDGIFDGVAYQKAGGRYGVGSDSDIRQSLAEELRLLEYSQRLRDQARNCMGGTASTTARGLLDAAGSGGAQAGGWPVAALQVGAPCDITVLNMEHPAMAGRHDDDALNAWVFNGDNACIADIVVAGEHLVTQGRHRARERIRARFVQTMNGLMQRW